MFEKIKGALDADSKQSSGSGDILNINHPGETFLLRLLPYTPKPEDTFFHYFTHGWKSKATGQYVSAFSPTTFQERDPIAEARFKIWSQASEQEKEQIKKNGIRRQEKYLVNVYVVEDPVNPENNGKVKVLRYGKQIHGIIESAISGEDADEFGAAVFDLSDNGVDFKLRVTSDIEIAGKAIPTYTKSRFGKGKKLGLSKKAKEGIEESTFNLSEVFNVKTVAELQEMVDTHWFVKAPASPTLPVERASPRFSPTAPAPSNQEVVEEVVEEVPEETPEVEFNLDDKDIDDAIANLDLD